MTRVNAIPTRTIINRHVLRDRVVLGLLRRTETKPYFRDGVTSPSFEEHIATVRVELPSLTGPRFYEVPAHTLAGDLQAGFRITHWAGPGAPTIMYHHGGAEYPFDKTFLGIFNPASSIQYNLIVVCSPGHQRLAGLLELNRHLSSYLALMAVSVVVTEHLIQLLAPAPVLVSGYSLGGFITNRHHVAFNSATAYVPFMAGTAHAEIFLSTWPAAPSASQQAAYLRDRLNFTNAWKQIDHSNVFPVLGLYDCLNLYETQYPSYGTTPVEVWPVGHLTGVVDYADLRHKILRHIPKV